MTIIIQVTGGGEGERTWSYYSIRESRCKYQLYRIRCQNRYGNFTRKFDTALYIFNLTILNINRIHSSQTYVRWSYNTLTWFSRLSGVGSQIGVVLSPTHRTVTIIWLIQSLLRIFRASCREPRIYQWNGTLVHIGICCCPHTSTLLLISDVSSWCSLVFRSLLISRFLTALLFPVG